LKGQPLAFIVAKDTHSRIEYPSFDPEDEYVIVPNMKKGDMLVFFADYYAHGSVIIEMAADQDRHSISFIHSIAQN
jgi:hypothetical protein